MGSFAGHIDEAIFFIVIAFWWILNTFPRHIQSISTRRQYRNELSYSVPCGKRRIPIEAIFKTALPVCGFTAELWSRGPAFTDEEGNFRKPEEVQHMSIFGIFIAHGMIDIMCSLKSPLPQCLNYLSAAAAFAWYGMSFSFHAGMPGKEPLEAMVHTLPVSIMYLTALCILLEHWHRDSFILQLMRIFCLLVLGTYFTQVAFVLFRHDVFPGWQKNPSWDQSDYRNVHFIVAAFGFHLCLHMVTVTLSYLVIYGVMHVVRRSSLSTWKHSSIAENGMSHQLLTKNDIEGQEARPEDEEEEDEVIFD